MKKFLAIFLAFILFIPTASALAPDISDMSVAELLALREAVDARLLELGQYPFVELKSGDKGNEVTALQERLIYLGYFTKVVTGKYDSNTVAAMKAFEKASGLKQDGAASVDEQKLLFGEEAISKPTPTPKPTPKPTPTPKPSPTPKPTPSPTPKPTPTAIPTPRPTASMGERNALNTAKMYLEFVPFSYSGLIEQLEYEGYTHKEAIYGADYCGADWNEQAAKCAKNYLEMMSFSKSGLIKQLEYEGFTTSQARYGASQNGY